MKVLRLRVNLISMGRIDQDVKSFERKKSQNKQINGKKKNRSVNTNERADSLTDNQLIY